MSGITTDLFDGNVSDVSFDLAVPTLNPTELGGSTGALSFATRNLTRPQLLRNRLITIAKNSVWSLRGRISDVTWGPHRATNFQAETPLQRLNITVSIKPQYLVTQTQAMDAALAHAGFTSEGLADSGTVTFPGWTGTLLDYVKHFCNYARMEYVIGATSDIVTFRALRNTTITGNRGDVEFGVNDQTLAQSVEVIRYNYLVPPTIYSNIEFTPAGEDEAQIISVNAGETSVTDLKINGWVASLNQPVAALGVGPEARVDMGAYQVLGSNGLPVSPATWNDQGGSVVVATTEDPTIIRVSVTAPDAVYLTGSGGDARPSPYSLAVNDDKTTTAALYITGKGVLFKTQTVSVATGVEDNLTYEKVGATVDNPFVSSADDAWNIGIRAAQYFAGANQSASFSIPDTQDIESVLGARVLGDAIQYRVNSVSWSGGQYTVSCSDLVTIDDFDTLWDGLTIADFDTAWAGKTISEFNTLPLDS